MKPILTALLIAVLSTPAAAECLIQANSIGGIQQFPHARLRRTSDGEGVSYIAIALPNGTEIIAHQASVEDDSSPSIQPACQNHHAPNLQPNL